VAQYREIRVLKVEGTGTPKVSKSRQNQDRPSGRTRGNHRYHRGNPDKESIHRRSEFIGISGIPVTSGSCIVKSRSAKPRSVENSCQP
jgi:hypothetical protein